MRLVYVRALATTQRYADAVAQLEALTQIAPQMAPPWLTLGALQLELRQPARAIPALERYLALTDTAASPAAPASAAADADTDADDDGVPDGAGRTQAWLLLAQAAEQQQDFKAAEAWLAKVDNPQRALEVQSRRASLLARQGQVREARELIRRVPEKGPGDARAKFLAEAQLLRDVKQWGDANLVLTKANETLPGRRRPAVRAVDGGREAGSLGRHGAPAAPCHRNQARSPPRLQRAGLLAGRTRTCACPRHAR